MSDDKKKEKVMIGVAWPYANNSLHLGHVAGSLLAPDIFARFNRMNGRHVLMVSGSDEHGTPITVRAKQEGLRPLDIAQRYHGEHVADLERLGISFDLFFRTSDENHAKVVHEVFLNLLEKGYIDKRTMTSQYCPNCNEFLPDRYVEGTCPHCDSEGARGDQCDSCGRTLDPMDLHDARCKHCAGTPEARDTEHFFLRLSEFEDPLKEWIGSKDHWKINVKAFAESRLREGLKDRPITRDLEWGVTIPLEGMGSKRIYVWFEAVIGYLSASKEWARRCGQPDAWKDYWMDEKARHYYFLGKDNIPFHTIIWPAMLMGYGGLNLPYDVPANEYLTMKKAKMSKSTGTLVPLPFMLERMDPDALRYYICAQMPETHDADFGFEDIVERNNKELLNTLGNLFHRVILFTFKNFGEVPPKLPSSDMAGGEINCPKDIEERIKEARERILDTFKRVSEELEACRFKNALTEIMALAIYGNGFFQNCAPFKLLRKDRTTTAFILNQCLWTIKALTIMIHPILPHMTQRLWYTLGYDDDLTDHKWQEALVEASVGQKLRKPEVLVKKIELDMFIEDKASTPFHSLSLKVGRIVRCEDHPDAQKLQVLTVDLGTETRQIVTGLKDHYTNDELQGLVAVFVTNLKPAKLRGLMSNGMILAAEDGNTVVAITLEEGAKPGELMVAEGLPPIDMVPPMVTIEEFSKVCLNVHKIEGTFCATFEDGNGHRPLLSQETKKRAITTKQVAPGARIH